MSARRWGVLAVSALGSAAFVACAALEALALVCGALVPETARPD